MILLIDNYDSFTYNLWDYFKQLAVGCRVVRNDKFSMKSIEKLHPCAIVFSPGPKRPKDAGMMMDIIGYYFDKIPLLGICLGHQAIGEFFGARLIKATHPFHGKTSLIQHNGNPIFERLPARFEVMRYHSLILSKLENTELEIIAATSEKVPMAIVHQQLPIYGFQFHPESILTQQGIQLLRNWLKVSNL